MASWSPFQPDVVFVILLQTGAQTAAGHALLLQSVACATSAAPFVLLNLHHSKSTDEDYMQSSDVPVATYT